MEEVTIKIPKNLLTKVKILVLEEKSKWELAEKVLKKSKMRMRDVFLIDRKIKNSLAKKFKK